MRGAHEDEHAFDGIGVAQRHTFGAAQLTRLGGDAETTRGGDQRQRGLMIRTYDFEIAGLARVGQVSACEERATPGGLDLGDLAVDDVARQTQHHVFGVTAVQAGLQHQSRAALGDADYEALHHAGRRLPGNGGKRGFVAVQISDGVLQPYGRVLGIKLRLHENVVIHRVQTIAESNHRSRLCLFGDGQLVVDCGQLAFDVIQKSQEPTSYFPVLPYNFRRVADSTRTATGLL